MSFHCILTKSGKVLTCKNPNNQEFKAIIAEHKLQDDNSWLRIYMDPANSDYKSQVWSIKPEVLKQNLSWYLLDKVDNDLKCIAAAQAWQFKCVNAKGEYIFEFADGAIEYYKHGMHHCKDGPAIITADGTKYWFENDVFHRVDGPAIEWSDGDREFWEDGVPIRTESLVAA